MTDAVEHDETQAEDALDEEQPRGTFLLVLLFLVLILVLWLWTYAELLGRG